MRGIKMKNSDQNQSDNSVYYEQLNKLLAQLPDEKARNEFLKQALDKRYQSDSSLDKRLKIDVDKLHRDILDDCVNILTPSKDIQCKNLEEHLERWVFVFIRSVAIPKKGRNSNFRKIPQNVKQGEYENIEKYLNVQYQISPELRTYNELLVNRGSDEGISLSLSFSFDIDIFKPLEEQGDIHFDNKQIEEAISCLNFDCFEVDKNNSLGDNKSNYQKIKKLNKRRESIGLSKRIREQFWSLEENITGEEDSFFSY
jgi:hypothetical protein